MTTETASVCLLSKSVAVATPRASTTISAPSATARARLKRLGQSENTHKENLMTLTKRGRVALALALTLLALLALWAVDNAITPDECKTSPDTMSQACLDLVFPN